MIPIVNRHAKALVAKLGITDDVFAGLIDYAAMPPQQSLSNKKYRPHVYEWRKIRALAEELQGYGLGERELIQGGLRNNLQWDADLMLWKPRIPLHLARDYDHSAEYRPAVERTLRDAIEWWKFHETERPKIS